jgi:hypothetical protein
LGTKDGKIYHAAFDYSQGNLEVADPFSCVLEIPDAKAILDLKAANINFG